MNNTSQIQIHENHIIDIIGDAELGDKIATREL